MKRRLTFLVAFLVVLAAVIGPVVYMQKVFGSDRQNRAVSSVDPASEIQNNTAGQDQPPAGAGQNSTGLDKGLPDTEAKQGDPVTQQQSALSGAASPASASGDAAAVNAPAIPPDDGCPVGIAVVGKNGEQLYKAGQVFIKKDNKWGITALGALEAAGISYVTSPAWPDFVYSISGQANSGVSGWMYSVNGDVPMHMADRHPVKAGDRVIWWYSNSMEQPQPHWDDLIK